MHTYFSNETHVIYTSLCNDRLNMFGLLQCLDSFLSTFRGLATVPNVFHFGGTSLFRVIT